MVDEIGGIKKNKDHETRLTARARSHSRECGSLALLVVHDQAAGDIAAISWQTLFARRSSYDIAVCLVGINDGAVFVSAPLKTARRCLNGIARINSQNISRRIMAQTRITRTFTLRLSLSAHISRLYNKLCSLLLARLFLSRAANVTYRRRLALSLLFGVVVVWYLVVGVGDDVS